MNERRVHWAKIALALSFALALLTPAGVLSLMRAGVIVPAETTVHLGPLRMATTCYSRQRFCYPHENINPPPEELFLLVDWPDGERREDVLVTIRIR